jgi:hypothetical protein
MADITLVRQETGEIAEKDREAARRVIFGIVDGLGERGRKQWRRLWNGIMRLEPGEMVEIKTRKPRSGPFHRRHMKMEQSLFEQQDRFQIFDPVFRDWLKVGAGHVVWCPGPKGGVFPVPQSIDYDSLEDDEMREFHEKVVSFLRTDHAAKTLWPHLSPTARIEMIEGFLATFGE